MSAFTRCLLAALTLTVAARAATAQENLDDRPALFVPLHPLTQNQRDQREALHLFAQAARAERQERLVEAMRLYEQSARLDTEAVPVLKSLVMIYLSLERYDDALGLSKKILQLDPHDYQVSYLYARQLRNRNQLKEACAVLQNGLASQALQDRPDLHQQMECDLGTLHERLQQSEDAAAAFNRAAAILDHPDTLLEMRAAPEDISMRSAEMHERAGRNFLEARQFPEAVAAFQRAQARYPSGAGRLNFHLAQVHLRQGQLAEALAALDTYLAILPPETEAYELKIAVLQKLRRETEILPWLEKASGQDHFNVGLKLLLARQCAQRDQVAKAERIYRELADSGPTEDLYRDLFALYKTHHPNGMAFVVGLVDATLESATHKDSAAANNPAPAQARAIIGTLRTNSELTRELLRQAAQMAMQGTGFHAETLQLIGALAGRLEMLTEAEYFYRQCIKDPLPPAVEPLVYGSLLRVQWKAHHFEAVVETCQTGLKQTAACNHVLLRTDLARALGALERWEEALREADLAVQAAKDNEKLAVRILRVRLLTQAGKLGDAEADCLALLKESTLPGDILEVRYLLSGVYTAAKRLPQAEAELAECLRLDPTSTPAANDLGYLWAEQNKKLAEAEALIRSAIELDRKNRQSLLALGPNTDKEIHDNACYIDSLGWVLYRRGQLDEAIKQLEYAARLPDGDDPLIWDHLGDVCLALGRPAQAREAWQKALDFYQQGRQRKMDERYRLLQDKLQRLAATR